MRTAGAGAVAAGLCLFWCAWPASAVERASRLVQATGDPDPASFEIAALELAGARSGDADAWLALAIYREKRLRQPGTSLMLLALERHGLLAFASPSDVEREGRRQLDAVERPADFLKAMRSGADTIDPSAPDTFASASQALLAADRVAAQRLLQALGRTPPAWTAARAHLLAAKALAVLGDGPAARLEREIALAAGAVPAEAARLDIATELAALADQHLVKAAEHDRGGRAVEASHALEDALRSDPAKVPATEVIARENVGAVVEQDMARIRQWSKPARSMASALLSKDRQQQLDFFNGSARLIGVAHTCLLLGRASQGTAALDLIDRRFTDAYGEFRMKWLRAALEKR